MANIKNILAGTGVAIGSVLYLIMGILGLIIHLWTIIISLGEKGIIAALITLVVPVLAEIYWGTYSWNMTGTLLNTYCMALGVYILLFIISIAIISFSTSKMED